MRLRREARILKDKAVDSFRRSAEAFNSYEQEGRQTAVLLLLQHAFEMLLKAGLTQKKLPVFDAEQGRAIGFGRCVNLGGEYLSLNDDEAGLLRAIDALRDQEQHWFADISEGLLYAHVRAGVTLFDELLHRTAKEHLVDHIPTRVLPISATRCSLVPRPGNWGCRCGRNYVCIGSRICPAAATKCAAFEPQSC